MMKGLYRTIMPNWLRLKIHIHNQSKKPIVEDFNVTIRIKRYERRNNK